MLAVPARQVPTQMAEQFGRQFDSTSCTPRKYRSDWVRGHAFPPDFARVLVRSRGPMQPPLCSH
eukprot:4816729-Amphidinium_carterae.1